jgi:hypothetical protein
MNVKWSILHYHLTALSNDPVFIKSVISNSPVILPFPSFVAWKLQVYMDMNNHLKEFCKTYISNEHLDIYLRHVYKEMMGISSQNSMQLAPILSCAT